MSTAPRPMGLAGRAMRAAYVAAGALVAVAAAVRRTVSGPEGAERAAQRTGRWPRRATSGPWVWIHAASVGEADLAVALARALAARRPDLGLVVSSTTVTGRARAASEPLVESRYFPIDFAAFVRRIVEADRPRLFVAVETEIWPEAWRVLGEAGVPIAVANARLSDRSLPRYRALAPLLGPLLAETAIVCARDAESARRWCSIGVPETAIEVAGNLKFDLAVAGQQRGIQALFAVDPACALLLAASTHEGEDALVLDAFLEVRGQTGGPVLLLAPRHPPRAQAVADLARRRGLTTRCWSELGDEGAGASRPWPRGADVVVLDRLGLLDRAYRAASAAFVGGSAVAGPGGHNLLEAVAAGCPVAAGPFLGNVEDQAELLRETAALGEVRDGKELANFWLQVLADPEKQRKQSAAAAAGLHARTGALERTVSALLPLLGRATGEVR